MLDGKQTLLMRPFPRSPFRYSMGSVLGGLSALHEHHVWRRALEGGRLWMGRTCTVCLSTQINACRVSGCYFC